MTTEVFLSQLIAGETINARSKGERNVEIESLTNSIRQLGLLQPLSVRVEGDHYRVIDGNRRLAALLALYPKGCAEGDPTIPVLVRGADDTDAFAMSLAANIERLPMHEVDQYEAFARLASQGKEVADIARLFGISERRVSQRLALGNLPKQIRDDYRAGSLQAQSIKTLANADPKVLAKAIKEGLTGWKLVDAVTPKHGSTLHPNSTIAKFVGRDAYVEAGGTFITDLFVDAQDETWANPEIAMMAAAKKAEALCEQLVADGWSFAERIDKGWHHAAETPAGEVDKKKFTDKDDFKRWKELDKIVNEVPLGSEPEDFDEETLEAYNEMCALEEEYQVRGWTDEQKARLGVYILNSYDLVYGVAKPEAKPAANEPGAAEDDEEIEKPKPDAGISMALIEELSGHITRTAAAAIADDRFLAKVLLVDEWWQRHTAHGYISRKFGIERQEYRNPRIEGVYDYGLGRVEAMVKKAGIAKAKTFAGRIKAWMKLEDEDLDNIIALFLSRSLVGQRQSTELVSYLFETGRMKVLEHWQPTTENFFMKLTTAQLLALLAENGIEPQPGMKKAALAAYAREKLPEDWLPKDTQP